MCNQPQRQGPGLLVTSAIKTEMELVSDLLGIRTIGIFRALFWTTNQQPLSWGKSPPSSLTGILSSEHILFRLQCFFLSVKKEASQTRLGNERVWGPQEGTCQTIVNKQGFGKHIQDLKEDVIVLVYWLILDQKQSNTKCPREWDGWRPPPQGQNNPHQIPGTSTCFLILKKDLCRRN